MGPVDARRKNQRAETYAVKLRIGSRGSKLAVAQSQWVGRRLLKANPALDISYTSTITTAGDQNMSPDLKSAGGKGLFVKEIESALLEQTIDVAVHSLKDMPQALPPGLVLGPTPLREDVREAVAFAVRRIAGANLPKKSTVGTSSIRRKAQILYRFKKRGYNIEPLRGNVDTRSEKTARRTIRRHHRGAGRTQAFGIEIGGHRHFGSAYFFAGPVSGRARLAVSCKRFGHCAVVAIHFRSVVGRDRARAERFFPSRIGRRLQRSRRRILRNGRYRRF